jgi:uncharacterized RDD family membrane protein YckC
MSTSDTSPSADLIAVRAIDLDIPRAGSPERYPSPRGLRVLLGFVIDLALHLVIPFGLATAARSMGAGGVLPLWIFVGGFFGLSLVHRVGIQWLWQTTVGKWVTGLRLVREDTGGRPTLWQLGRAWWLGLWRAVVAPFELP